MKKQNYKKVVCYTLLCVSMLTCSGCGFGSEKEVNRVAPIAQSMEEDFFTFVDVVSTDISDTVTLTLKTNRNRVESLHFSGFDVKIIKSNFEVGDSVKEGDVLLESDASAIEAEINNINSQIDDCNEQLEYYTSLAELETSKQSVCSKYGIEFDDATLTDYNKKITELNDSLNVLNIQLEEMNWELYATKLYAPFDGIVGYIAPASQANDVVNSSFVSGDPDIVATIYMEEATFNCVISENHEYFEVGEEYTLDYELIEGEMNDWFFWGQGGDYVPTTISKQMKVKCTSKEAANENSDAYQLVFKPSDEVEDFSRIYTAEINMVLETKSNATCISKDALVSTSEGYAVYVLNEDGSRSIKNVEIGLESDTYVEILSGLEIGEQVISEKVSAEEENEKER